MNRFVEARGSEYDSIEAVNYSTLKVLRKSPKHYRHACAIKREPSAAMLQGLASHTAILEPHRFMSDYAMWEGAVRRGKEWEAFCAAHADKTIIRRDEYDTAIAMRDAVRSHPVAMRYLERGKPEVGMVWEDQETGIRLKGRVDWVYDHTIVGIKTTRDASLWSFQRDAARLSYHLQWAMYHDGFEAITGHAPEMVEICVETDAPHDVVVYRIPAETLQAGREGYRTLLRQLADCRTADYWPGQSDDEIDLLLPAWALAQRDEADCTLTIGGEAVTI